MSRAKRPAGRLCVYCGVRIKADQIVCSQHRELLKVDPSLPGADLAHIAEITAAARRRWYAS